MDGCFKAFDCRKCRRCVNMKRALRDAFRWIFLERAMKIGKTMPHGGKLALAKIGAGELLAGRMWKQRIEATFLLKDRRAIWLRKRRNCWHSMRHSIGNNRVLALDRQALTVAIRPQDIAAFRRCDQPCLIDRASRRLLRVEHRADVPRIEQINIKLRRHT
jgi:hypothetical protein